jgi:hypothetical protein
VLFPLYVLFPKFSSILGLRSDQAGRANSILSSRQGEGLIVYKLNISRFLDQEYSAVRYCTILDCTI